MTFGVGQAGEVEQHPHKPYITYDTCPFECCTYGNWRVAKRLPLREAASADSSIIQYLEEGVWVEALTGDVHTSQLGEIRIISDKDLMSVGDMDGVYIVAVAELYDSIVFKDPSIVYIYSPLGEGDYNAWYKGRFYLVGIEETSSKFYLNYMTGKSASFGVWAKKIVSEWWVKIRMRDGTIGWTKDVGNFEGSDQDSCS